jgi:hypothetical protein
MDIIEQEEHEAGGGGEVMVCLNTYEIMLHCFFDKLDARLLCVIM